MKNSKDMMGYKSDETPYMELRLGGSPNAVNIWKHSTYKNKKIKIWKHSGSFFNQCGFRVNYQGVKEFHPAFAFF